MPDLRIVINAIEYPCSKWERVEESRPLSVRWEDGFFLGLGEPRYRSPNRYYAAAGIDATSPPYLRLPPALTTFATLSLTLTNPFYAFSGVQPDGTDVVYFACDTRRTKYRYSDGGFARSTSTAGHHYGRPALFEGSWRLPLGPSANAVTLTIADDPALDTATSMGVTARHFAVVQDSTDGTAKLVRAHTTNLIDFSADASSFGGDFEIGESTLGIADMLETLGEIMVIKPDGPYKSDAYGNTAPLQKWIGTHPSASGDMGANSHSQGTFVYWVHPSGLWRIYGELILPVNYDADPNFYGFVASDLDTDAPFSSVVGYGRWLYLSRDTNVYAAFIQNDGSLLWHGQIYSFGQTCKLGMTINPTTNLPDLWIAVQVTATATIYKVSLEADGSMRAALNDARFNGSGSITLPRVDFDLADRTKQLRRFWAITEDLDANNTVQPRADLDGAGVANVGAVINTNGLLERTWTPGTSDTCQEFAADILITGDGTADPRVRAFGVDARSLAIYQADIPLTPDTVKGFSGGIRGMLSQLRHLEYAQLVAIKEPTTNTEFNGYVLRAREKVVDDGYVLSILLERADVPA